MRIAIAQLNYTVGDLQGNARKILDAGQKAAAANARLLVTSELAICGYPPLDLLNQQGFVEDCMAEARKLGVEFAKLGLALLIGCPWRRGSDGYRAEPFPIAGIEEIAESFRIRHNSALLFENGELVSMVHKRLLPTYGVFDERRWFTPGTGPAVCLELDGVRLGVHVCEDMWNFNREALDVGQEFSNRNTFYDLDPIADLMEDKADMLVNLSASPWSNTNYHFYYSAEVIDTYLAKDGDADEELNRTNYVYPRNWERDRYVRNLSEAVGVPVVLVNQVGANDSLIFDGTSYVGNPSETSNLGLEQFCETVEVYEYRDGLLHLDTNAGTSGIKPAYANYPTSAHHGSFEASDFGEHGKVRKEGHVSLDETPHGHNFRYWTEALEMGVRDYVRKTGHEKVIIGLSGGIDSALVTTIACHAIGPENVRCIGMPTRYSSKGSISDSEELCKNLGCSFEVYPIEESFEQFEKLFKGSLDGLALENIQPRIRGTILMALANQTNALVLAPGNKSELAVGYSTLYGDTVGCLEVIGDVYKSDVWRLARFYNRSGELIPKAIIDKEPSAELREEQRDSDSLPPYNILDPILRLYIDHALAVESIIEMEDDEVARFDEATVRKVCRLVDLAEFKRKQSPMVLRVSSRAFGPGRQMPVVNGYRPLG